MVCLEIGALPEPPVAPPPRRPTQDEARAFMARFEQSNERVRACWLPHRDRLFPDDFSQLPDRAGEPDPAEDYRAALDVLLYDLRKAMAQEHENAMRHAGLLQRPDGAAAATEKKARKLRIRRRNALARALRANKTDAPTRLELAALQMDEGAMAAARHNVQWVLEQTPEHPRALELLDALEAQERLAGNAAA